MNDQQSMPHRARAYARVSRLTNPAWITANQQGFLTPEQIGMLAKEVYSMVAYYLMVCYAAMLCLLLTIGIIIVLFLLAILLLPAGSFYATLDILSQFLGDLPFLLLPLLVLVGLCWIPFRVMTARLRDRFKRNVATGDLLLSLAREQGEVVWGNIDYIARTQEHVLTVPRGTGSLIPGPYHFYSVKNWLKKGCHTESCVTMYYENILNSVWAWFLDSSAVDHYTRFGMASAIGHIKCARLLRWSIRSSTRIMMNSPL